MLIKVSEAAPTQLDWLVAKCEDVSSKCTATHTASEYEQGIRTHSIKFNQHWNELGQERWDIYCPSTDWAQGGPIIEREKIDIFHWRGDGDIQAKIPDRANGFGPTPLIAAMRCYVTSKLGDEVDVPEVLK